MTEKKESIRLIKQTFAYIGATILGAGGVFALAYFALPAFLSVSFIEPATVASSTPREPELQKPVVTHLSTPVPLKAIYMTQCVVGTPSFRDSLVTFIDETELNAVVIDIKDFSGKISFPTDDPLLLTSVSAKCGAADMRQFIESLHAKGIYVIGRITVFQDPYYTSLHPEHAVQKVSGLPGQSGVWKDYKGLAFVDVGAKPYWDRIITLGKISYEIGFDELNFDYIRYPSDGPMSEAVYSWSGNKSKPQMLEEFYKYLADHLQPLGVVLSADLFGMTATNEDDLNIGQVLERALPYFDYIDPMVYPSHYPSGFHGYSNVNDHPYDIVRFSMDTAVARTVATTTTIASLAYTPIASTASTSSPQASPQLYQKPSYSASKMRPWLQSFDYPVVYTPTMVSDQIKANADAGLDSYLFWDAANKYNALREVLYDKTATSTD